MFKLSIMSKKNPKKKTIKQMEAELRELGPNMLSGILAIAMVNVFKEVQKRTAARKVQDRKEEYIHFEEVKN